MAHLVIDTDPGVDDAHALMIAFAHPGTRIEAITTVSGNVSLAQTTANACTILDVLEQDVPVYAGCSRALVADTPDAAYFHGKDGLGDSSYPPSGRVVEDEHAVETLIRLANESPGELTLVALGPLTNVALATRLDPALHTKVKRLVAMGGAIRGRGNTTPAAEFNVYTDPEAAAIVLDAWPEMTLVPWDAALDHPFSLERVEELMAVDSPRAAFFRRISRRTLERTRRLLNRKVLYAPDGLAVAAAIEPETVIESERHHVQVELAGLHTRGQTVADWNDRVQGTKTELVLRMDQDRLWELMQAAVR